MSTDGAYGNCIDETAKLYSRFGGLVYFYSYEYRATNSMLDLLVNLQNEVNVQSKQSISRLSNIPWYEIDKGVVCHGDELFSLFSLKTGNLRPYSDRDLFAQKRLITLWTEFASINFQDNKTSSHQPFNHRTGQFDHLNSFNQNKKTNLFVGPNALWPPFNEDDGQYLVLSDEIRVQSNYRKVELDFWKFLFDSELLTMERSQEQLDYSNLSSQKYAAFAYTMLTTTIFLMVVISFLLALLWYYTKRTKSFNTSIKTSLPGICPNTLY